MANRLSKIYTKTGDDGSTGLAGGQRVSKASAIIEAMGSVDELNCALGVLLQQADVAPAERAVLTRIQHELFDLGGELAMPDYQALQQAWVARLESDLDAVNDALPPLAEFILPGGSPAAAHSHLARAICRRAERDLVQLNHEQPIRAVLVQYLNRLSDLLFVQARAQARRGDGEVLWQHQRR